MKETFGTKNIDIKIEDKLKIKMIINKNISNMSSIFENCESLLEFVRNNNLDYDVDNLDNIYKMGDIDNNSEVDSIIPLTEISLNSKKEDLLSFSQNDYFNYDYYDRDIDKKEYTFYQNSIISEIDKNEEKENSMLSTVLNIKQMVSNIILNQNYYINFNRLFYNCSSLTTLSDISGWNTNNVIDMSQMFYNCSSLSSLPDISKWNTNLVINMNQMFQNCSSLKNLPDISKWNINKVVNLSLIFNNCSSLKFLPDISKWNINNVYYIDYMFSTCTSLIKLPDISKWSFKKLLIYPVFFIIVHPKK